MTTYQEYEDHILHKHLDARCGDIIELRLSCRQRTETPAMTTQRCLAQFTYGTGLIPHEIAVSEAHFATLSSRAIDVIWNPEAFGMADDPDVRALDGATIPVKIPYACDSSLPPGTVAARYIVPLCDNCRDTTTLVEVMRSHNFEVSDRQPGVITMTRLESHNEQAVAEKGEEGQ